MFTVKRFKFVSRQTLFNPIEFFAVVFLFSRHARSSSFFFTSRFSAFFPGFFALFLHHRSAVKSDEKHFPQDDYSEVDFDRSAAADRDYVIGQCVGTPLPGRK